MQPLRVLQASENPGDGTTWAAIQSWGTWTDLASIAPTWSMFEAVKARWQVDAQGGSLSSGSADAVLAKAAAATGSSASLGSSAGQLVRSVAASGASTSAGSAAATIPAQALGASTSSGSAGPIIPNLKAAASGATTSAGSAAAFIPAAAAGASTSSGSAAARVTYSAAASGSGASTGSAAVVILYAAAAAGATTSAGSAAATIPLLKAAAAGASQSLGSSDGLTLYRATASGASVSAGSAASLILARASGASLSSGTAGPVIPTLLTAASGASTSAGSAAPLIPARASGSSTSSGTAAALILAQATGASTSSGSADGTTPSLPADASGASTSAGSAAALIPARASGASTSSGTASGLVLHPAAAAGASTSVGSAAGLLLLRAVASGSSASAGSSAGLTLNQAVAAGASTSAGSASAIVLARASGASSSAGSADATIPTLNAAATGTTTSSGTAAGLITYQAAASGRGQGGIGSKNLIHNGSGELSNTGHSSTSSVGGQTLVSVDVTGDGPTTDISTALRFTIPAGAASWAVALIDLARMLLPGTTLTASGYFRVVSTAGGNSGSVQLACARSNGTNTAFGPAAHVLPVDGTWYRFSDVVVVAGGYVPDNITDLYVSFSGTLRTNGPTVIDIAGVQLEPGSSLTTYEPSAAIASPEIVRNAAASGASASSGSAAAIIPNYAAATSGASTSAGTAAPIIPNLMAEAISGAIEVSTDLQPNGDFAVDTTGWTVQNGSSRVTGDSYDGDGAAILVHKNSAVATILVPNASPTACAAVTVGRRYRCRLAVKPTDTARTISVRFQLLTSGFFGPFGVRHEVTPSGWGADDSVRWIAPESPLNQWQLLTRDTPPVPTTGAYLRPFIFDDATYTTESDYGLMDAFEIVEMSGLGSGGWAYATRLMAGAATGASQSLGTADGVLGLRANATGASTSAGTATATIPNRDAAATGASTSIGSADAIRLEAAAATGASTSAGSAVALLNLRAAASGASTSSGTAAAIIPAAATGASTSSGSADAVIESTSVAQGASLSAGSADARLTLQATASGASTSVGAAAALRLSQAVANGASQSLGSSAGLTLNQAAAAAASLSSGSAAGLLQLQARVRKASDYSGVTIVRTDGVNRSGGPGRMSTILANLGDALQQDNFTLTTLAELQALGVDVVIIDNAYWNPNSGFAGAAALVLAAYAAGINVVTTSNDSSGAHFPQITAYITKPNATGGGPPFSLRAARGPHVVAFPLADETEENDSGQLPTALRAGAYEVARMAQPAGSTFDGITAWVEEHPTSGARWFHMQPVSFAYANTTSYVRLVDRAWRWIGHEALSGGTADSAITYAGAATGASVSAGSADAVRTLQATASGASTSSGSAAAVIPNYAATTLVGAFGDAFGEGIGGWVSGTGAVSWDSTEKALKLTAVSNATTIGSTPASDTIAGSVAANAHTVRPGQSVRTDALIKPLDVARNVALGVRFYDAAGTLLATNTGTTYGTVVGSYQAVTRTFVAPANAAYVFPRATIISADAGERFLVKDVQLRLNASGDADATLLLAGNAQGASASSGTADAVRILRPAAAGGSTSSGTATAIIPTLRAAATGASTSTGSSAGLLKLIAAALGSSISLGNADGILGLRATAAGASATSGVANATRILRPAATGSSTSAGTAMGARLFVAAADGHATSLGAATAILIRLAEAIGASTSIGTALALLLHQAAAIGSSTSLGEADAERIVQEIIDLLAELAGPLDLRAQFSTIAELAAALSGAIDLLADYDPEHPLPAAWEPAA